MALAAGRLRHRITFEQKTLTQDPVSGDTSPPVWSVFAADVPAEWVPLSVSDFIAASDRQHQIKARVTIRANLPGLTTDMRILYRGQYYDPQGFLADADSGLEYLTIPVSESLSPTA